MLRRDVLKHDWIKVMHTLCERYLLQRRLVNVHQLLSWGNCEYDWNGIVFEVSCGAIVFKWTIIVHTLRSWHGV